MRISTQTFFDSGAAKMGDLQSGLLKTQLQISTGRRILSPSDDPVGAARALEVGQTLALNTQHGINRNYATGALVSVEGTLSSVTSLLQDVKTTIIAAGNGVLGDSERGFQATELRGRFEELMGLANARDGVGNYLFSGFQTNTPAFIQSVTGATYQGDSGQRLMQVDTTRQMAVSNTGQSVFQGGGQDMFATLTTLIARLETPGTVGLSAVLATANTDIELALENVLTVRASVGTRLQELDSLNNAGADRNIQYNQTLSELQDLDYTQALTKLSQQQVTLEAAQRTFVTTSKLSLFNFI